MKRIEAIVSPFELDEVRQALTHVWVAGLTVSEVKGESPRLVVEVGRGGERASETVPRLKVEVVVPDPLVPRLVHDLERALRPRRGDGRIFVSPVDEVVRVRTGVRGEDAL